MLFHDKSIIGTPDNSSFGSNFCSASQSVPQLWSLFLELYRDYMDMETELKNIILICTLINAFGIKLLMFGYVGLKKLVKEALDLIRFLF